MSQINESAIKTPGVYVNEIPSFPPSIAQVATAVPAFIGYTQMAQTTGGKDLTNKPTRITSLLEYELYFGKGQPEENIEITYTQVTTGGAANDVINVAFNGASSRHNMHAAIRHFYANGGGSAYICSIGGYKAAIGDALVQTEYVTGLDAVRKEDEPTLIVFPEGQNMVETDYYATQSAALQQCGELQDRFCIMDIFDTGESLVTSSDLDTAIAAFRNGFASTYNNYGAAYFPNLKTVYAYDIDETTTNVLHTVDGAAGPLNNVALSGVNAISSAAYNTLKGALNSKFPVILPPSPAVAGIYAAVDGTRGVWKAPANVGVLDVSATTFQVSDELQENLNIDATSGKSVDVIRAFTGKGILVWGARTLDGNSNDFRYISVRRFYIMVEESVKKAAAQFVFEPNDGNTWVRVRAMIENYLTNLWRLGALAGSKPEQAFYVKVGLGQTMTFDDILNGKMIVEIGMAPVRPAEFIILRFSQIQQQA
jgi:phage tail sheath protein FI